MGPRAGGSSSTEPSAATTPAASPTSSPSRHDPSRQEHRMSHDRDAFFIDGGWAAPASTDQLRVVSPHSEEVVATVPEGSVADIDAAVAAARRAFDEGPWPRMSPAE